jgi:hypothetical protein
LYGKAERGASQVHGKYARETPQKENENYRLFFKAYSHLKRNLKEAVFGGSSQVNRQYTRETSQA